MGPVLVAPLSAKHVRAEHLAGVWDAAQRRLEEADCLVAIGYSFPQVDPDAIELFKSCLRADCQVSVVDPSAETVERIMGLLDRRVMMTASTFEEYCDKRALPKD